MNHPKREHHLSTNQWKNIRDIEISNSGKHEVRFPPEFPFSMNFWTFTDDFQLTPNYHDYLEIAYTVEGSGKFFVENRSYDFAEGDLFVLSNREFHSLHPHTGGSFKSCALYFLPSFIYQAGGDIRDSRLLSPFFNRSRRFENRVPLNPAGKKGMGDLFEKLISEYTSRDREFESAVKTGLSEILLAVIRAYSPSAFSDREQRRAEEEMARMEKVFRYVRDNTANAVTLGDAARISCMSESHFCRAFRKTTGHTFLDYVNRVRIDRAKDLLVRSDMKIEQVAYESGFNSLSHFFKIFRRFVKVSPQEYSRRAAANSCRSDSQE